MQNIIIIIVAFLAKPNYRVLVRIFVCVVCVCVCACACACACACVFPCVFCTITLKEIGLGT